MGEALDSDSHNQVRKLIVDLLHAARSTPITIFQTKPKNPALMHFIRLTQIYRKVKSVGGAMPDKAPIILGATRRSMDLMGYSRD